MSDPAKTLKGFFAACDYDTEKAEDAFYALLAENRRLQEALELIAAMPQNTFEPLDAPTIARAALGAGEEEQQ